MMSDQNFHAVAYVRFQRSSLYDELSPPAPLLASLREYQSATGEELRPLFGRTLLPSVLDRAFKGEL
jgi:hypothetical protein